jgi:hypothetical protein
MKAKALDVAVGPGGRVFVVGTDRKGYMLDGGSKWLVNPASGGQASVIASASGPIVVNTGNQIWAAK